MAILSLNNNLTNGFNALVEIDQTLFSYKKYFTTETKTVDGMPDVKWHLKVYPIDPRDKTKFGIYMCIQSDKEIEYYVCDKKGSNDGGSKEFLIKQVEHTSLFDPRYPYIVNGKYQLRIPGTFSYKSKAANNIPKICNPVEWGLRLQQNSAEDFDILVDGEIFQIHKFIIAAESPIFKKMFENNFKEATEKKVTVTDFKIDTVKAFIDFCYGKNISTFFESESDATDLLRFSDKYDCQTLKPQLETYFASKLYVSEVNQANALQLRKACVEFVRKILHNGDFLTDEEMDSFDIKFMKDVFAFSRKI